MSLDSQMKNLCHFSLFDVPEQSPDPTPEVGRIGVEKGSPGVPQRLAREGFEELGRHREHTNVILV